MSEQRSVHTPQDPDAVARRRVAIWMTGAGCLGAVVAFLTWWDVWQLDEGDGRTGAVWLVLAIACVVLAVAGVVALSRSRRPPSP